MEIDNMKDYLEGEREIDEINEQSYPDLEDLWGGLLVEGLSDHDLIMDIQATPPPSNYDFAYNFVVTPPKSWQADVKTQDWVIKINPLDDEEADAKVFPSGNPSLGNEFTIDRNDVTSVRSQVWREIMDIIPNLR